MATKVIMPQLGESVVEGTVTRWLKQEGEPVNDLDPVVEISTDKVASEVPSPAGGVVLRILIPEGQTVRAGTVLAWIGTPEEAVPGEGGNLAPPTSQQTGGNGKPLSENIPLAQKTTSRPPGRSDDLGFISPVVARIARENQVDLSQVPGTGDNGRITKRDVLAYLEQEKAGPVGKGKPAAQPEAAWETPADGDLFRPSEMVFGKARPGGAADNPAPTGEPAPRPALAAPAEPPAEGELIPLTPIRQLTAAHMLQSKRTSPHVTTVMEADLSRVVAFREANRAAFERSGVSLTFTAFFISAAVAALKAHPAVNSSWEEGGIRLHPQVNIGMAVSLGDEGLIVPVIRAADGLSLLGLARQINDLAARARSHHLQPEEVRGGTFTITNHGISGSLFATPIIHQPQCAILGVGAIQKRAVVIEAPGGVDAIAIRPMVYLSLTFDHRILDGASADAFLGKIVESLQNWV